jgi:hypothetical protein
MNGNKFATGQMLKKKKTGRSCEGVDFSWLSSKIFRTLSLMTDHVDHMTFETAPETPK